MFFLHRILHRFCPSPTDAGLEKFEQSVAFDYYEITNKPADYLERCEINPDDAFMYGIRMGYNYLKIGSSFATVRVSLASRFSSSG